MHGDEFPRPSRLRATRFARNHSEKLPQNYEKSANLAALNRGGAADSARFRTEKSLRDYEKSARFSASEKNNRANFARNHDKTPCENRKVFANSGFTIIEVALVLAIAGLIFLVVFLALPALQRSQRDSARKQDVARVVTALQQYEADGGDLADLYKANPAFVDHKVDGTDPGDVVYKYTGKLNVATIVAVGVYGSITSPEGVRPNCWTPSPSALNYRIYVAVGCICDGNKSTHDGAAATNASVALNLEARTPICTSL